jgi:pilus assembly protein CpaB
VRTSTIMMIAIAAVFGLLAVLVTRSWLQGQADGRVREPVRSVVATRTIVVASRPLRYGHELAPDALREVAWPGDALPPGAFTRIDEVLASGKRVVLAAIEPHEPVLAMKITGPGQRATLSSLVGPGMKAVTIRVNDVEGVGGFVLPGDRVDVILTRHTDKDNASTHVLLQDVRVLAVDQVADERASNPIVPKAVTLEVDIAAGQKLGLAATVGTLSLLLRKAGESTEAKTARVTLRDLLNEITTDNGASANIVVMRRLEKQSYRVPSERARRPAYATAAGE